jgi:RNA polymerase sigma factor (sigma-70 family)
MPEWIRFESTVWTLIRKAKERDPSACDKFILKYRPAVISFIRKNGFNMDEAEDLAQDVFLKIFKNNVLEKADKTRGRFRSLIIAVTKNVMKEERRKKSTIKRAGQMIPLEQAIQESEREDKIIDALITCQEDDEEFDRIWVLNIMRIAFDRLRLESESKGTPYFEAFQLYLQDKTHKDIALHLKVSIQGVKNYIHRARLKLMNYIADEIASYSSSNEEYKDEINYLSRFLDERYERA